MDEFTAGMYSALPYALAQVLIEIPYYFFQAAVYGVIVYACHEWTAAKFFWYLFFKYFTLLYFTFYERIPLLWRWCPVAWTLYGVVASQYGDVEHVMKDNGFPVKDFMDLYLGFEHDDCCNIHSVF